MEQQYYLPKNIRQIGQVDKKSEIYIEDYIITFARKLAEQNKNSVAMAVLLGKELKQDDKTPIFISGAVKITKTEENESVLFDNKIWSDIYGGVKNYFSDLEIVGFMILPFEKNENWNDYITQIHKTNFKENGKLLFIFDKEEKEENFYRFENGQFEKQSGYYIYYEKNKPMQNYLIDLFGNKSQESDEEDKLMEQVRELIANKESHQAKKTMNFVYAASTVLVAVVLVMGITTLNHYDKMQTMEKTLNHLSANIEENELVVETITGTVQKESENKSQTENEESEQKEQLEQQDKQNESQTGIESSEQKEQLEQQDKQSESQTEIESSEQKEQQEQQDKQNEISEQNKNKEEAEGEAVKTMKGGRYYTVRKGDTLLTISGRLYGSDEYVKEIKRLNEIENEDMIYEGQKLLIP